jgi:hypothetical protein
VPTRERLTMLVPEKVAGLPSSTRVQDAADRPYPPAGRLGPMRSVVPPVAVPLGHGRTESLWVLVT